MKLEDDILGTYQNENKQKTNNNIKKLPKMEQDGDYEDKWSVFKFNVCEYLLRYADVLAFDATLCLCLNCLPTLPWLYSIALLMNWIFKKNNKKQLN